jgi:hypothetical protein
MRRLNHRKNIIEVISLRKVRWAEHVAHKEQMRKSYEGFGGKPRSRRESLNTKA